MGKIKDLFNLNGPFLTFMGKLLWVIIINLVYIVSCLPVISIGGATKAMYSVMFQLVEDRKVDFFGNYLNKLFHNFLTSLKLTITMILVGAVCVIDILYFLAMGNAPGYVMLAISIIIALVFFSMCLCAFPILAIREGNYKETIRDTLSFIKSYPGAVLGALLSTFIFAAITFAILWFPVLFMFRYMLFLSIGLNALVIAYIVHRKLILEGDDSLPSDD